eukprot:354459-Chlamydomonas_euryale.AAC.4
MPQPPGGLKAVPEPPGGLKTVHQPAHLLGVCVEEAVRQHAARRVGRAGFAPVRDASLRIALQELAKKIGQPPPRHTLHEPRGVQAVVASGVRPVGQPPAVIAAAQVVACRRRQQWAARCERKERCAERPEVDGDVCAELLAVTQRTQHLREKCGGGGREGGVIKNAKEEGGGVAREEGLYRSTEAFGTMLLAVAQRAQHLRLKRKGQEMVWMRPMTVWMGGMSEADAEGWVGENDRMRVFLFGRGHIRAEGSEGEFFLWLTSPHRGTVHAALCAWHMLLRKHKAVRWRAGRASEANEGEQASQDSRPELQHKSPCRRSSHASGGARVQHAARICGTIGISGLSMRAKCLS